MTGWGLQDHLAQIVNMLLDRHPMGIKVLTGDAPPPSSEEIFEMYVEPQDELGVRVEGGDQVTRAEQMVICSERFNNVIKKAGGWGHIYAVARDYQEYKPTAWAVAEEHSTWIGHGNFDRKDDSQLRRICDRHGISPDTARRYRRLFPYDFAVIALKCRSQFALARMGGPSGKEMIFDADDLRPICG